MGDNIGDIMHKIATSPTAAVLVIGLLIALIMFVMSREK